MSTPSLPLVAFDEAGNTGADLLNNDQPVFTLASVNLSDTEANTLLGTFTSKASELKFSSLRRTARGRSQILEFLSSLDPSQFMATLTHKSYMVTAKVVDLLIEPLLHRDGIDLYAAGGNIAMTNVIHECFPVLLGENAFRDLQSRFVAMLRVRDDDSIDSFYDYSSELYSRCIDSELAGILAAIIVSQQFRGDIKHYKPTELDPAIPSFFQHCAAWGSCLGTRFDLVHDDSKPIAQAKDLLTMLMPVDEPTVTVGADRRTFQLPLKATCIRFARSHDVPQLQLADLLASSLAYLGRYRSTNTGEGQFVQAMIDAGALKVVIDGLWPSPDVDPSDLGTAHDASPRPMMDKMSEVIGGYMRKRTPPE